MDHFSLVWHVALFFPGHSWPLLWIRRCFTVCPQILFSGSRLSWINQLLTCSAALLSFILTPHACNSSFSTPFISYHISFPFSSFFLFLLLLLLLILWWILFIRVFSEQWTLSGFKVTCSIHFSCFLSVHHSDVLHARTSIFQNFIFIAL